MTREELKRFAPIPESSLDALMTVARSVKEETVVKKKMPVVLIALAIALLIAVSAAVAASFGVFDYFAKFEGDDYLRAVDQAARTYTDQAVPIAAENGFPAALFTLDQAHYDGRTLFCAYALATPWSTVTFLNPDDASAPGNDIVSEQYRSDTMPYFDYSISPADIEKIQQSIDEGGRVYFESWGQMVDDTRVYTDRCEIGARRMNLQRLPDGTVIGYTEFQYPLPEDARNLDRLELEYVFHRGVTQCYYDETGFYEKTMPEHAATIRLPVTVQKSAQSGGAWRGSGDFGAYTVTAFLHISEFDAKADILVHASKDTIERILAWQSSFSDEYDLYTDDGFQEPLGTAAYVDLDAGTLRFTATYALPARGGEYRLVPQFALTGDRNNEAIFLQKDGGV